jgi:hypothetical protein
MKLKTNTASTLIFDIDTKILDTIEKYINELDPNIISKLINDTNDYEFVSQDNTKIKLLFLGKGDEGTVYGYNKLLAIKFFVLPHNKELEFMKKLQEYKNINTLRLYKYFVKDNHLITIINKADGNIDKWINNINKVDIKPLDLQWYNTMGHILFKPDMKFIDLQWYNLMVQILFGVLLIQDKLMMYHKDLLHRNILYKKLDKIIIIKYKIDKFSIVIYTDTIFFITDFGKSQSLLPEFKKYNTIDDNIIKEKIESNADLNGIASIYKKVFVNYIYHNIEHNELYKMIENNNEAQEYLKEIEKQTFAKTQIISKPSNYVKLQVTRSLCYYLIENNYIDISKLNLKINIPSKKVRKILESLDNKKSIKHKLKKIKKNFIIYL